MQPALPDPGGELGGAVARNSPELSQNARMGW